MALSAYAGAVGLATGTLDLGHTLNRRLPFDSPVLGAIALVVFVAVPATTLARQAAGGDERTPATAVFAGAALIAWIVIEIAFIREFSPLQPFFAGVGVSFAIIGLRVRASETHAAVGGTP